MSVTTPSAQLTVQKLLQTLPQGLTLLQGSNDAIITEIVPPDKSHATALVFASEKALFDTAKAKGFGALCIPTSLQKHVSDNGKDTILVYKDLPQTFAALFPLFDKPVQNFSDSKFPTFVDPTAKLGKSVAVEPFAVIGRNCIIGNNCRIGSHCIIEEGTIIGDGTILHGHVFIGRNTKMGANCIIHANTTIGSDGFGFARQASGAMSKIPQLGIVVIEDDVEIGANCAIDRATMTETRIGRGTKIDNLCHIAHNCKVGENNVLAAGLFIAGSSQTGNFVTTGGGVMIADHVKITNQVMLAGKSGVTKDIETSGAYGGYPLQPLKESLKNIANIGNLTTMRKQLHRALKALNLEEEEK
ncbi:MAG: UDP-3-O-(3-hydroxymyristoyl)glucosamine N-acyltransferase [Bdellovibrionota bacterium]